MQQGRKDAIPSLLTSLPNVVEKIFEKQMENPGADGYPFMRKKQRCTFAIRLAKRATHTPFDSP